MLYLFMIVSIRHKGLRLYYEKGDSSKLQRSHLPKIRLILTALDAIDSEADIKALGKNIHLLKTGNCMQKVSNILFKLNVNH